MNPYSCSGRIFSVTEFTSNRKVLVLALAGIFIFVCLILLAGLSWTAFRSQEAKLTVTHEPGPFKYCGVQLTSLCVVSFGRDVFGNTIINLYVPEDEYAPFYLNVIRASGESRYDCTANKKIRTSVYCTGRAINLGEGFEVQMIGEQDDLLLAQGTFTLNAFLVATPVVVDDEVSEAKTSEHVAIKIIAETPTSSSSISEFGPSSDSSPSTTVTPMSTSSSTPNSPSYPNYP